MLLLFNLRTVIVQNRNDMQQFQKTTKHNTDDDMKLFEEYQKTKVFDKEGKLISSDIKLRNKIAVRNERLVLFVIKKFFSYQQDAKEDLIQEGNFGLFNAIDNFDPSRGFKFSTYSCWWIKQACSSYLMDLNPEVKVPSHVRTNQNKILRELKDHSENVSELDMSGAAERFGITPKMLMSVKAAMRSKWVSSISDPCGNEEGMTLGDTIVDKSTEETDGGFDKDNLIKAARKALMTLDSREKNVLLLRYNVIDEKEVVSK